MHIIKIHPFIHIRGAIFDGLSGGQRQKIVLAREKIHDSDIILIDEGTSAIDQKVTMNILEKLLESNNLLIILMRICDSCLIGKFI